MSVEVAAPSPPASGTQTPVSHGATTPNRQQGQQQQQQVRAKDIPISHGPKLLRKKHTAGAPQPEPSMASNATAAVFAAKVRFAEPAREETREERKKREKEAARREKEDAKREKERAKTRLPPEVPLQGVFAVDYVKEAEIAREREFAKASAAAAAASSSKSGRKLSKRR